MGNSIKYTCFCCGYRVHVDSSGSDEICPICYWQDDPVQITDPTFSGGANEPSLIDSQKNYKEYGVFSLEFKKNVRKPTKDDEKDSKWYPISSKDEMKYPRNIYYWDSGSPEISDNEYELRMG